MLSWIPLCSHLSLTETVRGRIEFDTEEVAALYAARRANATANGNVRYRAHRAKERAKDETAYKAKATATKKAYDSKNRDRVNKNKKNAVDKRKAAGTYCCNICNLSFATAFALNLHTTRKAHADKVTGIETSLPSKYATQQNACLLLKPALIHARLVTRRFRANLSLTGIWQLQSISSELPPTSHQPTTFWTYR